MQVTGPEQPDLLSTQSYRSLVLLCNIGDGTQGLTHVRNPSTTELSPPAQKSFFLCKTSMSYQLVDEV